MAKSRCRRCDEAAVLIEQARRFVPQLIHDLYTDRAGMRLAYFDAAAGDAAGAEKTLKKLLARLDEFFGETPEGCPCDGCVARRGKS